MLALVVLGLLALLLVTWMVMYNTLIVRRNRVDQAYSTIDVQLVQRYDLIPKLVETVKRYAAHERELLEEVVRLRNQAVASSTPGERLRADARLSEALDRLRITMESYPELKASENFLQLQRSLNEVEEQIAAARRAYNGAVVSYNNAVQTVPLALVARTNGFHERDMYIASERKREDVDVGQLFS